MLIDVQPMLFYHPPLEDVLETTTESDWKPEAKNLKSSDARWRSNLKTSFQLIQRVATKDKNSKNVCGKNVRKVILDEAYTTIIGLEATLAKKKLDVDLLRSAFETLEKSHQHEEAFLEEQVSKPKTASKPRKQSKQPTVKTEHDSQPNFIETMLAQEQEIGNLSGSSSDPMKEHTMEDFDLERYLLSSTPKRRKTSDDSSVSRRTKFASYQSQSMKSKRKLDMESAFKVSPVTSSPLTCSTTIQTVGEWFVGRLDGSLNLSPNLAHSCVHGGGDGPPEVPGSHFAVHLTELSPVDAEALLWKTNGDGDVMSSQSSTGSVTDLIIFPSPIKEFSQPTYGEQSCSKQDLSGVDQEVVEEFLTSEGSFRILDVTGVSE